MDTGTPSSNVPTGIVVFDSSLAKQLIQNRFPTGYLGVRRLRPTNRAVARAAFGGGKTQSKAVLPPPIYKTIDSETGNERRMTSKEKKKHKRLYEKRKRDHREAEEEQEAKEQLLQAESTIPTNLPMSNTLDAGYIQLNIDSEKLEEEIADLRGEREGVPPVLVPPPLAALAQSAVLGIDTQKMNVLLDDEWAGQWALDLKKSMILAEDARKQEDLRPMPYHLVPEVWKRMRPASLAGPAKVQLNDGHDEKKYQKHTDWRHLDIRDTPLNNEIAAIIQLLHEGTGLHIACGAKFGCEYLLYDGPRSERHAFAGIRFGQFADAYDLSGYVRCLNTAGKLALLATASKDINDSGEVRYRVAIVDLALVKIVETTFKKPKKTMEQRLKNLNKKS